MKDGAEAASLKALLCDRAALERYSAENFRGDDAKAQDWVQKRLERLTGDWFEPAFSAAAKAEPGPAPVAAPAPPKQRKSKRMLVVLVAVAVILSVLYVVGRAG